MEGCDNDCAVDQSINVQRGLVWRQPREFSLKEMEPEMTARQTCPEAFRSGGLRLS